MESLYLRLRKRPRSVLLATLLVSVAVGGFVWYRAAQRPREILAGAPDAPPETAWTADGRVVGLGYDVLEEAARRGGYRIKWVKMDAKSGGCDTRIRAGTIDLCPTVGVLPERQAAYHLSRPWIRADYSLVSRAKARVYFRSVSPKTRVSFTNGAVTRHQVAKFLPQAIKVEAPSRRHAVENVCAGKADAAMLDTQLFLGFLHDGMPECRDVRLYSETMQGAAAEMAIAGPREKAAVIDDLRSRIDDMRADGFMAKALATWTPTWSAETDALYSEQETRWKTTAFVEAMGAALVLVVVLFIVNRRLAAARRAAERAAAARSEFIANMSHEIRTPLTGILSTTSLLREVALPAEARQFVDVIHDSGQTLHQLLSDILDLKKIEAGKFAVEETAFDPRAAAQAVAGAFRGLAAEKELGFEVEIEEGVPQFVRGDVLRFRQLTANLISNAIKFTPRGRVEMRVRWTGGLRVEVKDTGIGIAGETRAQLFGKFVQGDATITKRYGGSGLGLSLCKALVETLGGEIGVESEAGEGSTFWFELPWRSAEAGEAAASGPAETGAEGLERLALHVLLAEDNPTNQWIVRKCLERAGWTLDIVDNGATAVERAVESRYDAVLMDCRMPVLDGYEAARQIRAHEGPGRDVPIIALTASVLDSDRALAKAAGMNAFLSKPIHLKELVTTLASVARAKS